MADETKDQQGAEGATDAQSNDAQTQGAQSEPTGQDAPQQEDAQPVSQDPPSGGPIPTRAGPEDPNEDLVADPRAAQQDEDDEGK